MSKSKLFMTWFFVSLLIYYSPALSLIKKSNEALKGNSLQPEATSLTIYSKYGGIAYLDGQKVGKINYKTGLIIKNISPGTYKVMVRVYNYGNIIKPEYMLKFADWESEVHVEAEKSNTLEVTELINIRNYLAEKRILYKKIEKFGPESDIEKSIQKNINFIDKLGNKRYVELKCDMKYLYNSKTGATDLHYIYNLNVNGKLKKGEKSFEIPPKNDWNEIVTIDDVQLSAYLSIKKGLDCGIKLTRTDI